MWILWPSARIDGTRADTEAGEDRSAVYTVAVRPRASMACLVVRLDVSRWCELERLVREGGREMYLDEENICPSFGEGDRHGLADTSCATCNKRCLSCEGEEFLYGRHGDIVGDAVFGMMVYAVVTSNVQFEDDLETPGKD
jgi:hypothetical protein